MTESEGHTYLRDHQIQGEAIRLDLNEQGAELLSQAKGSSVGRAARTLVKQGPLRLTLLALAAGHSIDDHRAPGPTNIAVVNDGAVSIAAAGNRYDLGQRQTLMLDADVSHALQASRDTVLLLTIAMTE